MMEYQLEHKMLTFNKAELSLITLFGFFPFYTSRLCQVNNGVSNGRAVLETIVNKYIFVKFHIYC